MEENTELSLLLVVHLLYEAFLSLDEREIITPNISNAIIVSVVNADIIWVPHTFCQNPPRRSCRIFEPGVCSPLLGLPWPRSRLPETQVQQAGVLLGFIPSFCSASLQLSRGGCPVKHAVTLLWLRIQNVGLHLKN